MKKFFAKALAILLVCLFALSAVNFSIIADDSSPLGEKLMSVNLKIRGSIRMMFYFTDIDNVEFFEVKLPQANGSMEAFKIYKNRLKYDKENNRYLLEVPVIAAQQSDQITIQAFDAAGNAGKLRYHSVKEYAAWLFDLADSNPSNKTYADAAKAVESMLNYGAMAQTFFGYNTTDLANNGLYFRDTNPVNDMAKDDLSGITAASAPEHVGDSIRFTGVNAHLEEAVSLRFYFEYMGTKLDSPKDLTVQIEGKTYANEVIRDSNGKYYILISNIPSTLYNKQYEVRISEDENNYAVLNYSVFNYIQAKLDAANDDKFDNLAYSMFQFYTWTNNYLGVNTLPASCTHERTHITASDMAVVCSDCGHVVSESAAVSSFTHDGEGNVTTNENLSYKVSGGEFAADDETGFTVKKDQAMTLSGISSKNFNAADNRFHLSYYASAPVKLTMNYANGKGEYYYLEAGENVFSAVEVGFPASSNDSALSSITVEPLTSTVDFVLFGYSTETVGASWSPKTYSVGGKNIDCYIQYLGNNNTRYKLGINLTWGGAISELCDNDASDPQITETTNLVNNFDVGRLIQQSYYGTKDYETHYWRANETLAYSEWHYNPVQAGDAINGTSRIIDFKVVEVDENKNPISVYVKAQPRDWATYDKNGTEQLSRYTECYVENWYTVSDTYIKVDNRMVDFSGYTHPITTQELPAFYTLSHFNEYYWYSGNSPWSGELTVETGLPFWGDPSSLAETTFNYQESNTETWAAFVNSGTGYGIGLYVPNVDTFKGGIVDNEATDTNSSSSNTSYFAPLKELQIVCYEPIEYSYLICTGSVEEIRSTFKENKDFTTNSSLNNNSISKKFPDDPDMTTIDFSKKENLLFISSVNDALFSYDNEAGAVKFTTTATTTVGENKFVDSYFQIDYTMCQDIDGKAYPTSNYSYIEFEYMMPANQAGVQELYYQVDAVKDSNGAYTFNNVPDFVTLIADGEWHTAKFCISTEANWTGNIISLRVDFLNGGENAAGQEFYLRSFGLTNGEQSNNGTVKDKFLIGCAGDALKAGFIDGTWDKIGAAELTVYDGDYVRAIVGDVDDRYVGFRIGGGTVTGKYMVIKYRTDAIPKSMNCEIYATAGSDTVEEVLNAGNDCSGYALGWVGDGNWHTLIIDLSLISDNVKEAGEDVKINDLRIDLFDCFEPGAIIDIAYIGLCKDIDTFKASLLEEDNKYPERSDREWSLAVDSVQMDEIETPAGGTNHNYGANSKTAPVLEGSVWNFTGWFAINGVQTSSLEYCITEEDGTENRFIIHYSPSASGATTYFDAEQTVIDYVRDNNKFTNPEDARRLHINADLLAYLGQTVAVSIRAITSDGYAVVLYAVKVNVTAPKYNSLNFVFKGDDLYREMFGGDHDAIRQINQVPHAVVKNEDGTVSVRVTTLRSGGTARKWIGFQPDTSAPTGKYMVIKYRTNGLPSSGHFYVYNASSGETVKSESNKMSAYGFVGDGNWHTLVIDLSNSPAVNVSPNYKYFINDVRLQMLDNLADGEVVDFEYVGFCDNLENIPLKDGEHLEYSWQKWSASVDTVTMDGQPALKNSAGDEAGASQHGLLSGGQWAWSGGWFAIDGQSAKEVSVCITEEDGTAHRTTVTKGATNTNAPNTWWEQTDITSYVKTTNGYSEGTVGYRVNLSANLLEFLGQTVTVSVRAITDDDRAVTVYSASVQVPLSATAQWITGRELKDYAGSHYNANLNDDGSVTLTALETHDPLDNYTNWFSNVSGIAAPKYAIIRYRTDSATFIGINARTDSGTGYRWATGDINTDGKWHNLVLDLEGTNYVVGEAIKEIRIDTCDYAEQSITIDYVYLCDTIGDSGLDYSVDLIEKNNSSLSSSMGTIDRTPDGLRITSAGFTADATRMSINLNGAKTGKYLVMTYRYASTNQKNAGLPYINVWTSTINGGAIGGDNQHANVLADGRWHTVVVDISKNKTVTANDDGTYSLKYLSLDVFSPASACAGDYLDISYIGFSDDFNEIADEFGETKYSVAYQLNNNGTLGLGQLHSQIPNATTVTRSKTATSNITGFATVNGKITDVYYQIVAADGSTAGWTNATSGIFNPGDDGYETYNSQSGTARVIWLDKDGNPKNHAEGEDIENAATFEIPASALEGYSAGDVITVLVAVKTTDMVEGSFAVLVSCTMTFTE